MSPFVRVYLFCSLCKTCYSLFFFLFSALPPVNVGNPRVSRRRTQSKSRCPYQTESRSLTSATLARFIQILVIDSLASMHVIHGFPLGLWINFILQV